MKRRLRRIVFLLAALAAAAGSWFLFPSPFVHGIIVGILGGLGTMVLGFALLMRRLKKRMGGSLSPPPLPGGRDLRQRWKGTCGLQKGCGMGSSVRRTTPGALEPKH